MIEDWCEVLDFQDEEFVPGCCVIKQGIFDVINSSNGKPLLIAGVVVDGENIPTCLCSSSIVGSIITIPMQLTNNGEFDYLEITADDAVTYIRRKLNTNKEDN